MGKEGRERGWGKKLLMKRTAGLEKTKALWEGKSGILGLHGAGVLPLLTCATVMPFNLFDPGASTTSASVAQHRFVVWEWNLGVLAQIYLCLPCQPSQVNNLINEQTQAVWRRKKPSKHSFWLYSPYIFGPSSNSDSEVPVPVPGG
jgi:hypothetical protein